jgi:3-oxoacyl-[acyl-carrier-protein] synthase II
MAIEDSVFFKKKVNRQKIGIFEGTSLGGLSGTLKEHTAFLSESDHKFNPQAVRTMMTGAGGSMVSLRYGLQGPIFSLSNGSASSAFAFSAAVDKLRLKDIDVAIVGGSEAPIGFEILLLFARARMLSIHYSNPEQACRPFDAERNGTVLGEGAAVFILERLEHALKREAKIYAEVGSVVLTSDAYSLVVPEPEANQQARAMQLAMQKASVPPDCVDYISAHGTGTYFNDKTETLAIKKAFGEKAYHIPISSSKAMFGHPLGASTALEVAKTIIAMQNQLIPPTINLEHPDPECDLDYVPNHSRKGDIRTALVNNSSFGGKNSSIVLKKWE